MPVHSVLVAKLYFVDLVLKGINFRVILMIDCGRLLLQAGLWLLVQDF